MQQEKIIDKQPQNLGNLVRDQANSLSILRGLCFLLLRDMQSKVDRNAPPELQATTEVCCCSGILDIPRIVVECVWGWLDRVGVHHFLPRGILQQTEVVETIYAKGKSVVSWALRLQQGNAC